MFAFRQRAIDDFVLFTMSRGTESLEHDGSTLRPCVRLRQHQPCAMLYDFQLFLGQLCFV